MIRLPVTSVTVTLLALLIAATVGCSQLGLARPDTISLRLSWLTQAQFAGSYVAKEKGYFKEENLDVSINPGSIDADPIRLVASGSDTFGIVNADQLVVARSKSVPIAAIASTL